MKIITSTISTILKLFAETPDLRIITFSVMLYIYIQKQATLTRSVTCFCVEAQ